MTSKIKKPNLPVHYAIEDWEEQGLRGRSMLMTEQMFFVKRDILIYWIATVDDRILQKTREISLISLGIKV